MIFFWIQVYAPRMSQSSVDNDVINFLFHVSSNKNNYDQVNNYLLTLSAQSAINIINYLMDIDRLIEVETDPLKKLGLYYLEQITINDENLFDRSNNPELCKYLLTICDTDLLDRDTCPAWKLNLIDEEVEK